MLKYYYNLSQEPSQGVPFDSSWYLSALPSSEIRSRKDHAIPCEP